MLMALARLIDSNFIVASAVIFIVIGNPVMIGAISVHSALVFMVSDTQAGVSDGAVSPKTGNPGRGTSSSASRLACSRSRLMNSGCSSPGTSRMRQASLPAGPGGNREPVAAVPVVDLTLAP
jgi:hypothetical protein